MIHAFSVNYWLPFLFLLIIQCSGGRIYIHCVFSCAPSLINYSCIIMFIISEIPKLQHNRKKNAFNDTWYLNMMYMHNNKNVQFPF